MKIVVREIVETDRAALRELFAASRNNAFKWVPANAHRLEDFDAVTQGERILVAVYADTPVGFASVSEFDSFLHNLFVHPEFQGMGVGKSLLAACERFFSEAPTLKCVKANVRAARFYVSQGWAVRHEAGGPGGTYLLMERAAPANLE